MKNLIVKELVVKDGKFKTGCIRKDIKIKNDKRKEVYGLWYRGRVIELKDNETISILFSGELNKKDIEHYSKIKGFLVIKNEPIYN